MRCSWLCRGCALGFAVADLVAVPAQAGPAIAIAPFEHNAAPGAAVPDVETLLADRIATQGVEKVVGPAQFGAEADAEPDDEAVRAWAKRLEVATVVVGRTTRIGRQVSVDVQLRSGETGEVAATYVAEILSADRLAAAVDRLASQILDGVVALDPANATAAPAPKPGGSAFGISFDSDKPISIRSDELESVTSEGTRRLLFTQNVVVEQDGVTIRSQRLEAFYPPDTSQPERLLASGQVRMTNGKNEARCDQATYERSDDRLICRGNAELRDESDCVAGKWIEFDLGADTVKVGGGATVVIGGEAGAGTPASGACQ
jgi:lipopolysaccharide transport protein LptA